MKKIKAIISNHEALDFGETAKSVIGMYVTNENNENIGKITEVEVTDKGLEITAELNVVTINKHENVSISCQWIEL